MNQHDAFDFAIEANDLMTRVRQLQVTINTNRMSQPTIHKVRDELFVFAHELESRGVRSLRHMNEVFDYPSSYYDGSEEEVDAYRAWVGDQIERVECALMRIHSAINMLKCIP